VHVILDNYTAHKQPNVRRWLSQHRLFAFSLHPRRRVGGSTQTRQVPIEAWRVPIRRRSPDRHQQLAETNYDPKPFTWTADPDKTIAAVRCRHQMLDSIH
jgi:catalase